MRMIFSPMFDGYGIGKITFQKYFLPNTFLCIWDRAFPYVPCGNYVKLKTETDRLMIGEYVPKIFEGKVYQRIYCPQKKEIEEVEITKDGLNNRPLVVPVKVLKSIPFRLNENNAMGTDIYEEKYSIEYLQILPDDMDLLVMFFN